VISARNDASAATTDAAKHPEDGASIARLSGAESMLTKAMGRFKAVVEAYPDLKADATIERLMEELSTTENRVSFARQAYNDSVMTYHNEREQFPSNLVAGFCGFKATLMFEPDSPAAREAVKVQLR